MNSRITWVTVLMVLIGGPTLFFAESSGKEAVSKTISCAESLKLIKDNQKNKNFLLLDVRTPEEFLEKHIKGAVNINFHGEDFSARLNELNKTKKILISRFFLISSANSTPMNPPPRITRFFVVFRLSSKPCR